MRFMLIPFFLLLLQKKETKKSSPKTKRLFTVLRHPAVFGGLASLPFYTINIHYNVLITS